MIRFKFKADCTFHAEGIDDACLKISEHFRRLVEDENYEGTIVELGELHIKPIKEREEIEV